MFKNYKTELDFAHHNLDRECKMVIKNKFTSFLAQKPLTNRFS